MVVPTADDKEKRREYDKERRDGYKERKKELRRTRWREKEKEALKKRLLDRGYWPIYMVSRVATRARRNGMVFELEASDIPVPEFCPVLGIPLILGAKGRAGQNPNSPSVDRIDNKKGYLKNNVRVISLRANLLKKDATLEEMRLLLAYMERELS